MLNVEISMQYVSFGMTLCLPLSLPPLSLSYTPSLAPFHPLRCVFFAVGDMTVERNQKMMMLPTAWQEQHSHYNCADVYCCWHRGAHCNINTRSVQLKHAQKQRDAYVNRPRLGIEAWLQVSLCVSLQGAADLLHAYFFKLTQGFDLFLCLQRGCQPSLTWVMFPCTSKTWKMPICTTREDSTSVKIMIILHRRLHTTTDI